MTQNRPSWLHRARRDRPSPGTLCPVVTSQGHRDFLHSLFLSASSAFLLRRPGDQFPGGGASFPTYHPICATRHRLGLGLLPPPSTLSRATVVLSFGGCSVLQRSSSCNNKALGNWSLSIASLATSPGWELETGFEQTRRAGEVGARIRTPPASPPPLLAMHSRCFWTWPKSAAASCLTAHERKGRTLAPGPPIRALSVIPK